MFAGKRKWRTMEDYPGRRSAERIATLRGFLVIPFDVRGDNVVGRSQGRKSVNRSAGSAQNLEVQGGYWFTKVSHRLSDPAGDHGRSNQNEIAAGSFPEDSATAARGKGGGWVAQTKSAGVG